MTPLSALIVDDHLLFREGLESLLRKIPGISDVHHAGNSIDAISMSGTVKPDVIFMDIRMPGINGIETTRHIHTAQPSIPIVALTMMEDISSVASMFRAGARGYLLKNTSFAELQEAIDTVLSGKRYFSKEMNISLKSRKARKAASNYLMPSSALSVREMEVLGLICRGFNSRDIADMLTINIRTVETHRSRMYEKFGVTNAVELAFLAVQTGLFEAKQL